MFMFMMTHLSKKLNNIASCTKLDAPDYEIMKIKPWCGEKFSANLPNWSEQ